MYEITKSTHKWTQKDWISTHKHASENNKNTKKGNKIDHNKTNILLEKHFYLISISCDVSLHEDIEIDVWSRKESQI